MEAGHQQNLVNTQRLVEAGVRLMAGSDCGWGVYPFGRFDLELQAMVNGGLSPMQALAAASSGNAEALGISDQAGAIMPGKEADLLVVDGRPDLNISDLTRVTAVFKAGKRVR